MYAKLDETERESEKAILDATFGWLPKSQCWRFEDRSGQEWIAVPGWLRRKFPKADPNHFWVYFDETQRNEDIFNFRRA